MQNKTEYDTKKIVQNNNTFSSKTCPKCGCAILPDTLFCVKCGIKIIENNDSSKKIFSSIKAYIIKDWQDPAPKLNKLYWWLRFVFVLLSTILFSIIFILLASDELSHNNKLFSPDILGCFTIIILCILFLLFLIKQHKNKKIHTKKALFIRFSIIFSIIFVSIFISAINGHKIEKARIQEILSKEGISRNNDKKFIKILVDAYDGNCVAQYKIGTYYYWGKYMPKDYNKAYMWFEKASEKPLANNKWNKQFRYMDMNEVDAKSGALFYLGVLYDFGYYVQKNPVKTIEYYKKAAALGNSVASYNLGNIYAKGDGVIRDDKIAFDYYYDSAEKNYPMAQTAIGLAYLEGTGTKKNIKAAVKWLTRAAENGDAIAQSTLGNLYLRGEGVSRDINKAKELLNKSMQGGNIDAKRKLRELNDNE